ncbi:hypothetical protein [Planctobacterium marinum]|uniref:hypothetical protein n=1 Tax=Planctobacterium marinum TaxID=1631968 RepID=UPI001E46D26A|nr:hypothetical protein [Planctobacterium marinum]MCC2604350.1 hypothetical protein [Planctobacterium marinum]
MKKENELSKRTLAVSLLLVVAIVAAGTAIAHMSCIYLGPQCFEAQYAPMEIVESARQGTLLAPLGTIFVSALFLAVTAYALSAAGFIRVLPLLKAAIITISSLCVIRGILPIQLKIRHPELVDLSNLLIGLTWLLCGIFLYLGYRMMNHKK